MTAHLPPPPASAGTLTFLDVRQVTELLAVPVNTMYDYAKSGIGPRSFKIGRHRRWDHAEVLAWIERQKTAAR